MVGDTVKKKRVFEDKDYVAIPMEVWDKFCKVSADLIPRDREAALDWRGTLDLMRYTRVGFSGGKVQAILDQYVDLWEEHRANEADTDA